MTSRTSVQKNMIIILVITYVLTMIAIFASSQIQENLANDYEAFVEVNEKISAISVAFPESLQAFKQHLKEQDFSSYQEYAGIIQTLDKSLLELDEMVEFDPTTKVFYRNILGMYDNYKRLVAIGYDTSLFVTPETYDLYNEIDIQMDYMVTHMHLMTNSYLKDHNKAYEVTSTQFEMQKVRIYAFITVTLVFGALLTAQSIKRILLSINKLCIQASLLSENNWDIEDIEEDRFEELHTLAEAFNNMKHEIIEYVSDQVQKAELSVALKEEQLRSLEKEQLLNATQLKSLQMQMNPHFLFNTLNIISRLALFEDIPDITKVVEELSEILRYNLYYKDELVSLEKELEVLKAYTSIQSIRFEDNIVFEFDICDDTTSVMIPPMILQPIVENAIVHGCKFTESDGRIEVVVYEDMGVYHIAISDNGFGFDPRCLEEKEKADRIGLNNVKKRLSIIFGRDDLLTIDSKKGEGTVVVIKVPVEV